MVKEIPEFITWYNNSDWKYLRKMYNHHQYYATNTHNKVVAMWDFDSDVRTFIKLNIT